MRTLLLLLAMMLSMTAVAQIPFEDTPTTFTATTGGFFVSEDVNGDGYPDYFKGGILTWPVGGNPIYETSLLLSDGSGNVTEDANNTFSDLGGSDGKFVDLNNDEKLDVFQIGRKENGQLIAETHFGDGNGNFSPNQSWEGLSGARAAFGDLDNDGDLDLIVSGVDDNNNPRTRVYENENGSFTEIIITLFDDIQGDVAIFDNYNDNNGYNDVLLIGNRTSDNIAKFYKNNGNFNFSLVSSPFLPTSGPSIIVADLDNDGDDDLGVNGSASIGYYTYIYLNNGDGTYADPQELTGVRGEIVFEDLDLDGFLDTFIIGDINQSGGKAAKLYLNDGTGNMIFNRSFNPGLSSPSVIIVDTDNDSLMDIVYTGNEADFPFVDPVIKLWRNTTLGVEDFTKESVVIYPNPTHGIVNVELSSDIFATNYTGTDMSGKQFKVSNNGTEIDLSSLASGMYLLTLHAEDGQSITKRVIKN